MINAHLGLTYRCNMNCRHCYVKEKEKHTGVVHPDILLTNLEQLGTFYITYTMGETLLWPEFWDFARNAKSRGFYQILLSNGSTIQEDSTVQRLIDCGIKKVGISIDSSDPAIHDANRGYEGAYEGATKAISLLSRRKEIVTQIATTISGRNISDIPAIVSEMQNRGANSFSFLWLRSKQRIAPIEDSVEYEKIMKWLILLRDREQVDVNIHDFRANPLINRLFSAGEISAETRNEFLNMNTCHALQELVLINPTGEMYACNFSEKPFANIYHTPLEQIAQYQITHQPLCGE